MIPPEQLDPMRNRTVQACLSSHPLPGARLPQWCQQRGVFYGWVIVVVSFITLFLVIGTRFSLGVFYVAILEEFQWRRGETAGVFSLMLTMHAIFSLLVGALFDRFGPRLLFPLGSLLIAIGFFACSQIVSMWQLYIFLGVLVGLGTSTLAFVPHMALVSIWFDKHRGTASGIAYAGIGGGQLVLAPLIQNLIDTAGWRSAFVTLAFLTVLVVAPLTALLHRRRPQDVGLQPDGTPILQPHEDGGESRMRATSPATGGVTSPPAHFRRFLRMPAFWLLLLTATGLGVMLNTLLVHQMAHITDAGHGKLLAASLLGIVGGLRLFGGMSIGALSDKIGRKMAYALGAACCAIGVALFCTIPYTAAAWPLYGFVILYGVGHGALGPVYAAATGDLFPARSLGLMFGILEAAYGLGGALGAFVTGYAYDALQSYTPGFVLVILATLVSCVGLWLTPSPAHQRC
jgi:MFS family permease